MNQNGDVVHDNNNKKRVCIVGAGVSGLPSIKALLEEGHVPVCYEKTYDLGGLWNYRNLGPGEATVMRTTVINTSKEMMSYSDFPPPDHWPNFFHNTYLNKYLHDYATHFNLHPYIHYGVQVEVVKQAADYDETGAYLVKTNKSDEFERFDAVMLCTGHHANPYQGHINGLNKFTGKHLHAQWYYEPESFKDKKVLLIGIGNSALDISVDLANVASKVYISTRNGAWIWNRLDSRGLPFDSHYLSWAIMRFALMHGWEQRNTWTESMLNVKLDHDMYGLRPKHQFFSQHATLNDHLQAYLASGQIVIKDDILDINDRRVTFTNGSEIDDVDVIISCTGYTFGYPFLQPDTLIPVKDNDISLYKTVFPPHLRHPTLAVIGLIQPYGAIQPIAELQTRWMAQLLSANLSLPSCDQMHKSAKEYKEFLAKRYYSSKRNTIQVDYIGGVVDELAETIGVYVNKWRLLFRDPSLAFHLILGPSYPYMFRLQGPHKWDKARATIMDGRRRICRPLCTTKRGRDTIGYQHHFSLMTADGAFIAISILSLVLCWVISFEQTDSTLLNYMAASLVIFVLCRWSVFKNDFRGVLDFFSRIHYTFAPNTAVYDPDNCDTAM